MSLSVLSRQTRNRNRLNWEVIPSRWRLAFSHESCAVLFCRSDVLLLDCHKCVYSPQQEKLQPTVKVIGSRSLL